MRTIYGAVLLTLTLGVFARESVAQDRPAIGAPRRLIVHADDIGISRSVNRAAFAAAENGAVSSLSVMVPALAFDDAAQWLRTHPAVDVGVHLTLTCEWPGRRWGPVLPREMVPSLVEVDGSFHRRWDPQRVNPAEAEQELRAQILLARAAGLHVTHLDVHQFVLFGSGAVFSGVLTRIARDERLPVLLARHGPPGIEHVSAELPGWPVLAQVTTIGAAETPARWARWYETALRTLPPGTSELIVHPGYDDADLRDVTGDLIGWGAAWRQRDLDVLLGPEFRRLLDERGIRLISWRELAITVPESPPEPRVPPPGR